tara:strand:- start:545 stop:769 length:225 start_codon:yes stop_codon:yes gene_type:complete
MKKPSDFLKTHILVFVASALLLPAEIFNTHNAPQMVPTVHVRRNNINHFTERLSNMCVVQPTGKAWPMRPTLFK